MFSNFFFKFFFQNFFFSKFFFQKFFFLKIFFSSSFFFRSTLPLMRAVTINFVETPISRFFSLIDYDSGWRLNIYGAAVNKAETTCRPLKMEKPKTSDTDKFESLTSSSIVVIFRFLTVTSVSAFFTCILLSMKNNWDQSTGKAIRQWRLARPFI